MFSIPSVICKETFFVKVTNRGRNELWLIGTKFANRSSMGDLAYGILAFSMNLWVLKYGGVG